VHCKKLDSMSSELECEIDETAESAAPAPGSGVHPRRSKIHPQDTLSILGERQRAVQHDTKVFAAVGLGVVKREHRSIEAGR
jgi:hypothetical protein